MGKETTYTELIGKTMVSVENKNDSALVFTADSGEAWQFYHYQDCCESVYIESIDGDLSDLVGSPILVAVEAVGTVPPTQTNESITYTFYKFATAKGHVGVRWCGTSNGYYSESVDFMRIKTEN